MRRLSFVDWVFALVAAVIVVAGAAMMFGRSAPPTQHQNMGPVVPASHSDGLSEAESGYRFERVVMPERRGTGVPVAFRILGGDGEPVTRFLDDQTKQLHFFVVRDDMHVFRHVHPVLDGDTELVPVPAPGEQSRTETGYSVTRVDEPAALASGSEHKLRFAIRTPDGTPVEALEPHPGANGHMTGFHTMLLSATHLHPVEPVGAPLIDGELTFRSVFAERGEYRLFLEFSHHGRLHTAAVTVAVE